MSDDLQTQDDLAAARDRDTCWRTLFGEAVGEGVFGLRAVAGVLDQRAAYAHDYVLRHSRAHPLYGDGSIRGVCLAYTVWHGQVIWQFSCQSRRKYLDSLTPESPGADLCIQVTNELMSGNLDEPFPGATHYHTILQPPGATTWPPKWTAGKTPLGTLGHHVFYSLGPSG